MLIHTGYTGYSHTGYQYISYLQHLFKQLKIKSKHPVLTP